MAATDLDPSWFDILPDAVIVLDMAAEDCVLNRAARRLFAGISIAHLRRQLAHVRGAADAPTSLQRDDGSRLPVEWQDSLDGERVAGGALLLVCRRSIPIPSRDAAEASLGVGAWTWFPDDNEVHTSLGVREILGLPAAGSLALDAILDVLDAEDRGKVVAGLTACREDGVVFDAEVRVRRRDGALRWIRSVGAGFDEGTPPRRVVYGLAIDVDESHRIRAELERREAMLARTERIAAVGSWDWDIASGRVAWSAEVFRMFGVDPRHTPPPFPDHARFYDPDDFERLRAAVARALEAAEPYDFHVRYRATDGRTGHARVRGEPVVDGDGRVDRLFGFIQDVTELREAEEALRRSERLLANSERVAGVGGWTLDLRDGSVAVSDNWMRIHGLDPAGPRPRRAADCMPLAHPGDVAAIEDALAATISRGEDYRIEHRIRRTSDGDERTVSSLGAAERDADGAVVRIHGASFDVTDQRRAERDRERLQYAIDQSSDIVMVTDSEGAIEYVNPTFERVTGWAADEAIGRNPRFLASGEQPLAHHIDVWRTISSGRTWHGRFVNRRRDGTRYVEQASISPVRDRQGAIVQYVSVTRDITAELEREERHRTAQRLEAIGRLAGGVAHDFNNMLLAIIGNVELLRDRCGSDAVAVQGLDQIESAAERAADLTRQLLTFARRQTLERRVVALDDVVTGMLSMLAPLMPPAIELSFETEPNVRPVYADATQLEQVVANFVLNARDAVDGRGRIRIRTANVKIEPNDTVPLGGEFVELSVHDSGPGMSASEADRIFEPFYTTKGPHEGSGLGLATVYGIAQQNHGLVDVVTAPGEGSLFRFRLPAARDGADPVPHRIADRPPSRTSTAPVEPARVLLVEDDPAVRDTIERALRRAGYAVHTAASVADAIAARDEDGLQPDIVITDLLMPGGSGRDLVEQLRGRCPKLPILLISGFAAAEVGSDRLEGDGMAFLAKPFSRTQLTEQVASLLAARPLGD